MHLQITLQYIEYKSLIIRKLKSNNNKTKGYDLHSFSQLLLCMSISACSK